MGSLAKGSVGRDYDQDPATFADGLGEEPFDAEGCAYPGDFSTGSFLPAAPPVSNSTLTR